MASTTIIDKKRVHKAWAMYDWANSAYNLVITSTIFPIYYDNITTQRIDDIIVNDQVKFLGIEISNSALFNFSVAFAYLVIAILSPFLSSIADVKGNKKYFMKLFCYLGSIACCGMYFFTSDTITLGIFCFILAAIGYCGSIVFYNSYLPDIATDEEANHLSAKGFAYGYIGSVILQIICFVFTLKPEWFGQDAGWGSRFSFLLVGIWWLLFSQIPFRFLPSATVQNNKKINILQVSKKRLLTVWHQLQMQPNLKKFLSAFFFYSMGVQTVMLAATIFGSKTLNLAMEQLIITILIIQIVAIAGAYMMSFLSKTWGNIKVLILVTIIWIGICIYAYFVQTATQFYIIATLVGIVMGGIQSLSRSTFSKLLPDDTTDTTSYFSFYDVTEKIAIVIGMFSFGFIDQISGSMRNSILALIIFFFIGLIFLTRMNKHKKSIA